MRPQEMAPQPVEEPAPCDTCPHTARCKVELLACRAFVLFASSREVGTCWSEGQRQPVRRAYEYLFGELPPQDEAERKRRRWLAYRREWLAKRRALQ